jgi:hypothetical protein
VEQWMIHLALGLCESEVIVPYTMPITGGTKTQIFTVERDHPQATWLLFSYVAESKRIENKSSLWVCIQYSNLPKSPTSKLLLFCHAVSWTSMLTISLSCQWTVVTSITSQLKNIKKRSKEGRIKEHYGTTLVWWVVCRLFPQSGVRSLTKFWTAYVWHTCQPCRDRF